MAFPESGDYVFPAGLSTLAVDREADLATYWEPNVWMVHPQLDEEIPDPEEQACPA
jgi:hypothetical protein